MGSSSPTKNNEFGFDRTEMYSSLLANTVDPYDRHVFLCYKSPSEWPSRVEDSPDHPLPRSLASALKASKDLLPLKTRLTVIEGDGLQLSDGDVLIFPEMVKYSGLKETDVDGFVDDVLVNDKPWAGVEPETMSGGAYVFVCAHGSRDKRCGVCGPVLLEKFKEEIGARGQNDQVFVSACSHVGGHKYAGNLIIFGTNAEGKVVGDWYGYVTPADVPKLLDVHIEKGELIENLWRGQMGMKVEDAEKVEEVKPATETVLAESVPAENVPAATVPAENVPAATVPAESGETQEQVEAESESYVSCCQGTNGVSCCREGSSDVNGEVGAVKEVTTSEVPCKKGFISLPGWMCKWEQSDVLMAAGVVGAVATVAVAYSVFKKSA